MKVETDLLADEDEPVFEAEAEDDESPVEEAEAVFEVFAGFEVEVEVGAEVEVELDGAAVEMETPNDAQLLAKALRAASTLAPQRFLIVDSIFEALEQIDLVSVGSSAVLIAPKRQAGVMASATCAVAKTARTNAELKATMVKSGLDY